MTSEEKAAIRDFVSALAGTDVLIVPHVESTFDPETKRIESIVSSRLQTREERLEAALRKVIETDCCGCSVYAKIAQAALDGAP